MNYETNFVRCNPHPQGKMVADCVKRACTIASEINYHDIAIMLNRFRKTTGAKKFNNRDNWKEFVIKVLRGHDKGNMQYANHGERFTVDEYCYQVNSKAIVQCSKHLVALKNGKYYDTWESGDKSIYKAWGIPSYEFIVENIRTNYPKLCKGLTLERYVARPTERVAYREIDNPKEGVEYWVVVDEQTELPHYFINEQQARAFAKEHGHEIVFKECFN